MKVLDPMDHGEIFMTQAKNNNKKFKDPKNVQQKKKESLYTKNHGSKKSRRYCLSTRYLTKKASKPVHKVCLKISDW